MTFKEILNKTDDQILKGLRNHLQKLLEYDEQIFSLVVNLVVNKKYK